MGLSAAVTHADSPTSQKPQEPGQLDVSEPQATRCLGGVDEIPPSCRPAPPRPFSLLLRSLGSALGNDRCFNPTWEQRAFPSALMHLTCVLLLQHRFTGVVPGKGVSQVPAAMAYSSRLVEVQNFPHTFTFSRKSSKG